MAPPSCSHVQLSLERVSPVEHDIDPVAAFAVSTSRSVGNIGRVANPEIVRGLVGAVAQVRRVVPENARTHAHPRRNKIPQIPFAEQDAVAMELRQVPADASNPSTAAAAHRHIDALKVRADQDRSRCRRRSGRNPFGLHR